MVRKRRFRLRSESNDEEEAVLSDISDISGPDPPELPKSKSNKPKKTRHKFTHTQDVNMLKYIMKENRYNEIKGVALWKDMEILQITDHPKQSMKYRFIKTVVPNLHQYDIPKGWVNKLSYMFPEIRKKNGGKENAKDNSKDNFSLCTMLDKWKRQSPASSSSPKSRDDEKDEEEETAKEKKSESATDKNKGSNIEDPDSEATIPYSEVPTPHRWKKRQKYRRPLKFQSSSESESEEKVEKEDSAAASSSKSPEPSSSKSPEPSSSKSPEPSPSKSPEASPSKSGEDCSKEDNNSEKSDLSDYDKYLVGIAKNPSSSKKSPKSDKNISQSDTTNEDIVVDSEEEAEVSVTEDRRSRLQHRRHLKRIEKAFGDESSPSTSSHKKSKKPNLAIFVTESQPDELENEDRDDAAENEENTSADLREYETIISDIAKSCCLTNREVITTIFSFNGNIDKTIAYIKLGPELCCSKPWSKEEDDILSSTSEEGIKEIAQKRGKKTIAERLHFLENLTDDTTC